MGSAEQLDLSRFSCPVLAAQTGIAGQVNVICTRDRHLLHAKVQAYCAQFGIRVLRDTELLDELCESAAGSNNGS